MANTDTVTSAEAEALDLVTNVLLPALRHNHRTSNVGEVFTTETLQGSRFMGLLVDGHQISISWNVTGKV